MIKVVGTVLLIGFFVALSHADRFVGPVLELAGADGDDQASITRVPPTTDADRQPGFRTSHVLVPTPTPNPFDPLIELNAQRMGLPYGLVRAVVEVESAFDAEARSSAGAMGLMQLMPETAAELGVVDPYDPNQNVRGGATYLKQLLDRYDDNEVLALAAYNAGPGAVERHGHRVPPYAETREYVRRVRSIAQATSRATPADDGTVYKSYAIVDGWWTVVYSNVPPPDARYEVTSEVTPEDLAARATPATEETAG